MYLYIYGNDILPYSCTQSIKFLKVSIQIHRVSAWIALIMFNQLVSMVNTVIGVVVVVNTINFCTIESPTNFDKIFKISLTVQPSRYVSLRLHYGMQCLSTVYYFGTTQIEAYSLAAPVVYRLKSALI